jgi:hypothetical protein
MMALMTREDGRFEKGHKAGPGWKRNVGHGWTDEDRAKRKNPGGRGFKHTPEAKAKISRASRERAQDPEYRERHGVALKKAWETRDRTVSEETRQKLRASRLGKIPANKRGREAECARSGCTNIIWISPSREGTKRHCSTPCALSDRAPEIVSSTIGKMHAALQDGRLISDPELRLGAFLLVCGFDVHGQREVGAYRADWLDDENGLDWECDEPYWHSRPEVMKRAANRSYAFRRAGYARIGLEPSEIPSWDDISDIATFSSGMMLCADEGETVCDCSPRSRLSRDKIRA